MAAHRPREERNVDNDGLIQLVSIGHATHIQHKHEHQPKHSLAAPWFRPRPLASSAVIHIAGWRLSTCNMQPIHQNPGDQGSIPQAWTLLSYDAFFIGALKTPNIGVEILSSHHRALERRKLVKINWNISCMVSTFASSSHYVGTSTDNVEKFKKKGKKFNKHTREE